MAAIIALTATCKRVWWRLRREYRTVVLPAYSADRRPQGLGDPFTHQVRFRVDLVRHPFTPTRCLVPAGGPLCHSRGAGRNGLLSPRLASYQAPRIAGKIVEIGRNKGRYRAGDQCMHDDLQGPQRRIAYIGTITGFLNFSTQGVQTKQKDTPTTSTHRAHEHKRA
ncbi:hypothetical protein Bbelb_125380 [Branchiostoma belcheri]|nr:hypothetical protein Bbelb_125380 [Branchiostoma belcheri]